MYIKIPHHAVLLRELCSLVGVNTDVREVLQLQRALA